MSYPPDFAASTHRRRRAIDLGGSWPQGVPSGFATVDPAGPK